MDFDPDLTFPVYVSTPVLTHSRYGSDVFFSSGEEFELPRELEGRALVHDGSRFALKMSGTRKKPLLGPEKNPHPSPEHLNFLRAGLGDFYNCFPSSSNEEKPLNLSITAYSS
jgi:hypothetical protein